MDRKLLVLFVTLFLLLSFPNATLAEEQAPSPEDGVKKSRAINDFLSEARKAKRADGVSVETSSAEKTCYSPSSTLEECQAAVAEARGQLTGEIEKREAEKKEQENATRTIVDEKQMSNREVRRLANSPANRPRPIGQPAPAPGPIRGR